MSVIEMHSTWIAINSVLGCPNGCKYCLLQASGNNVSKPKELVTPKEAVSELIKSKYYDKSIPVCLLPNTDVFVNSKNINYLLELLSEIENNDIKNDIVIITKCDIPNIVIDKVKYLKDKGLRVIFYISYSGLDKDIEPNISKDILLNNFKKLKENDIDVIHYFRPFLPQNSSKEHISEVLDEVGKYTNISVTCGLSLIPTFIDKIDFWKEIKENREASLKASAVWTKSSWEYFNNGYNKDNLIFQTNTCALKTKLNSPSVQYYGTRECLEYNHCSKEQRERCKKAHKEINKDLIINECLLLLKKLEIDTKNIEFNFDNNGLELKNVDLKISDASYLSYMLGVRVHITTNNIVPNTYNSPFNGAKALILGGK